MTKLYMKGSSILGRVCLIEESSSGINRIKIGTKGVSIE